MKRGVLEGGNQWFLRRLINYNPQKGFQLASLFLLDCNLDIESRYWWKKTASQEIIKSSIKGSRVGHIDLH